MRRSHESNWHDFGADRVRRWNDLAPRGEQSRTKGWDKLFAHISTVSGDVSKCCNLEFDYILIWNGTATSEGAFDFDRIARVLCKPDNTANASYTYLFELTNTVKIRGL